MWSLKAQLNCYAFPWPVALQSCVMPCRSPVPNGGMHINVPKNEGLLQETQHIINILLNKHCRKWKIVKVCVFLFDQVPIELVRSFFSAAVTGFRQLPTKIEPVKVSKLWEAISFIRRGIIFYVISLWKLDKTRVFGHCPLMFQDSRT